MLSGVVPVLYGAVQALVEYLPNVPASSGELELPLSVIDGFTRAYLLCNLIPPSVTASTSPIVAASPWTLLITSLVSSTPAGLSEPTLTPDSRSPPMLDFSSSTFSASLTRLLFQFRHPLSCSSLDGRRRIFGLRRLRRLFMLSLLMRNPSGPSFMKCFLRFWDRVRLVFR